MHPDDATASKVPSKMWTSRNVIFNQDCFPEAERVSGFGLHDVGTMAFGGDGDKILTVVQDDAAQPVADEVDDSTVKPLVAATNGATETEALQTLT